MSTIQIPTMAWTPSAFGTRKATALFSTEGAVSRHGNGLITGIDVPVRSYRDAKAEATATGIPAWRPPLS